MEGKGARRLKDHRALAIVAVAAFLIGFEAYTAAIVHFQGKTGLPQNIGNFERIRKSLTEQRPQEKFSFAVVSGTRGTSTFKRLCDELRSEPPSFMVVLGDFVDTYTQGNHEYFKFERANEYQLPFPVFLVPGKHDVVSKREMYYDFGEISLIDFEEMYGPRNFCFEYGGCLFVGLCILPYPVPTDESIKFLESTLAEYRQESRKTFVFTYAPPVRPVTGPVTASFENVQAFIDVIDRYKVDYVISSDYHDYDRTTRKDTVYLVTGGGRASLDEKKTFGGCGHAIVVTVDHNSVSEKAILASNNIGATGAVRHFAIAELAPFLRKHPALTVVENILVFTTLCVSLGKFIAMRRNVWQAAGGVID